MAKFIGNMVKSGRVGGSVFAIVHGVTIERQYQPFVEDAKSMAQVPVRAKFKMMSQLASVVGEALGFRRNGLVSPRNQFFAKNYGLATYDNDKASINMPSLDLSGGVVGIPAVQVMSRGGSTTTVSLVAAPREVLDAVVYVAVMDNGSGKLSLGDMRIVTNAGQDGHYTATMSLTDSNQGYLYAYGIKYRESSVSERYGSLINQSPSAYVEAIRMAGEDVRYITSTMYAAIQIQN